METESKKDAKRVVCVATDQKACEAVVDSCRDGRELFRIAKVSTRKKSDVIRVSCRKDRSGTVNLSADDQKEIWKKHI